jgi:hypothetical protein
MSSLMGPVQGRTSYKTRDHILAVKIASCYHCIRHFYSSSIREWTDGELTAICPKCHIDSVVAGKVDKETLKRWYLESFD